MFDYSLEYIGTYDAALSLEIIGPLPSDIRVNYYITGGEVRGSRIQGRLRPVGGDWLTVRADGVAVLDVRATIETHDGALIDVVYGGILDLGPDGHAAVLRGDLPEIAKIRTAPRLRTASPKYEWVNRTQFVGIGEGKLRENLVTYDVYALT
ncbi:MAG: hypothetical protein K0Q76_4249 [Panacagrimonas sp.]|nr:DUF3237 domain-containing protein [Panacagrimonas sp.]MCC2659141.1 hypothetical protein [Panacagrimonas sp.]